MTVREERATRARELRKGGLKYREIAERMGVATQTVDAWINDPDGSILKARKDSYRGECETCGKAADGSNGAASAPKKCLDCIRWTDHALIDALQCWTREYGKPPRHDDWTRANDTHPSHSPIVRRFGSWNNALAAAGLPLNQDKSPETLARMEGLIRRGKLLREVAAEYGVTVSAVRKRLLRHGTSATKLRVE